MHNFSSRWLCLITLFLAVSLWSGCTDETTRHLSDANQAFQTGDYEKAKAEYMNVLHTDPYNSTAVIRLGQIWQEQGAPWRAGLFLKKGVEIAPNDADNRLRLARVYQELGGPAEARSQVQTILRQSPGNGDALLLLAELARTPDEIAEAERAMEKFPQKENASYQLARANIALHKKDLATAQDAVATAIVLAPMSPDAYELRAVIQRIRKDLQAAEKAYGAAGVLAPPRSPFHIRYATFLEETAGPAAAAAYLQKVTGKAPDFLPAWVMLAEIAFNQSNYELAMTYLKKVFSYDSENINAHLVESDIRLAEHQPAQVITELEQIDQAHPGLASVKYRLATAYLQENKTDVAIKTLEAILKKQPDFKPARERLADAYRAAGRAADAANLSRQQPVATPESTP